MQSSKQIEIRYATRDDLPFLADCLGELFTLESDFLPDREKQLRGLRLILETPGLGQLFVLKVNDKLAGMASALITISTAEGGRVLLLEDVFVHSDFRGKGLGRRLLEHVLDWACKQGMMRVTLLADHDNHTAINFYQKLGFDFSQMKVLRKKM